MASLKKCKLCRSNVSSEAFRCPHCGNKQREHGCVQVLALPFIIILLLYIGVQFGCGM